jgi:hypothetical protein
MPAGGGTAPDGCVDHSGDGTLMERVDYDSFEHLFRITLRDTRDGTSILLTASVPNLISMAHSLVSSVQCQWMLDATTGKSLTRALRGLRDA